jgi:hypothetical protein
VTPEEFADYEVQGKALGFAFVASGPLVRSSYHAAEGFVAAKLSPPGIVPAARPIEATAETLLSPASLLRKPARVVSD